MHKVRLRGLATAEGTGMRNVFTQLYLHCVWGTWDRLPLVVSEIEQAVYTAILTKCADLHCEPRAVGGMPDHIHLLVRFPTTLSVAALVKEVKGASSHLVTHEIAPQTSFKWQGSYGAFTVSKEAVPSVEAYIRQQKDHHTGGSLVADWETMVTDRRR